MPSPDNRHPVAVAVEWVSRITAIALEILAFIWLGSWLDSKFGTRYWTLVGVVVGPVLGFWHLLVLTRGPSQEKTKRGEDSRS